MSPKTSDDRERAEAIGAIWDALEDGDVDDAETALAELTSDAPDAAESDPEVLALRAAIMTLRGQPEAALETLDRAAALEPSEARHWLQSAEIALYAVDDPEGALERCDRALDAAEEDDDLIDAVLLKAEALIALGDEDSDDDAAALLDELDGCVIHDPAILCRAGDLSLTLGDVDGAERSYRRAIAEDPGWADGHYGLGMVCEQRGDRAEMIAAWVVARERDEVDPPPPWHMTEREFEAIAEAALRELPAEVRDRLANVPILVEDLPSEALIREGTDPRLLGLFSGVPLPDKTHEGQIPALDTIHLFQRNLERAARGRDHLAEEIRITVLHETAHYFGLDDDDLHRLGLG